MKYKINDEVWFKVTKGQALGIICSVDETNKNYDIRQGMDLTSCNVPEYNIIGISTSRNTFKKGEETMLDTLMENCGYHKSELRCCNNGYNCHHPDNSEGVHDESCEHKCSGCFAFACPVAYQKDPDGDDENCRYGSETVMVLNQDILISGLLIIPKDKDDPRSDT